MDRSKIEERVKELLAALERSAAQHNALAGRLAEAQEFLKLLDEPLKEPDNG